MSAEETRTWTQKATQERRLKAEIEGDEVLLNMEVEEADPEEAIIVVEDDDASESLSL